MLVLITVENGVKKIVPLTADAGAGNPVGSLLHTYKKSNPNGYLYCDGRDTTGTSEELSTHYPLLYAYLGSNILPDFRECVEVGAEQNTTDSIATHDVYTEGQFKDDQLQNHTHSSVWKNKQGITVTSQSSGYDLQDGDLTNDVSGARTGTTTHGKQKAVFVYIKATSGISENAQDNVINTLNEQRSYSTEEVNTGKKWIDGKPIYRKVLTATLQTDEETLNLTISPNMNTLVSMNATLSQYGTNVDFLIPYYYRENNGGVEKVYTVYCYVQGVGFVVIPQSTDGNYYKAGSVVRAIVEYTKTN